MDISEEIAENLLQYLNFKTVYDSEKNKKLSLSDVVILVFKSHSSYKQRKWHSVALQSVL